MITITNEKQVFVYTDENGKNHFNRWFQSLDKTTKTRVLKRIKRVAAGNYGDCKRLDSDIYELRLFFGSGYRIYFAERNNECVVLLCAGDKSSQPQDIERAKIYWKEYKDNAKTFDA